MEHLVARCPTCERPIWAKQLSKILGFAVGKRNRSALGFVAGGREDGKRGWQVKRGLESLADVAREGGVEAVEQLRRLAKQAFRRMWAYGLLTHEDIAEVTAVKKAEGEVSTAPAPARAVAFLQDYRPGSQVTARTAPAIPHINPNPAPAKALKWPPQ